MKREDITGASDDVKRLNPHIFSGKPTKKKREKHGNVRGKKFQSIAEYHHYLHLKNLEEAGAISDLIVHPTIPFFDEDENCVRAYTADFIYVEDGRLVVEDVKSQHTKTLQSWRDLKAHWKTYKDFKDIKLRETVK